jgi:hypothetical protein
VIIRLSALARSSPGPASKRDWFESDTRRVVIEGIDSETVQEILKSKHRIDLDEIREYMDTFSEMRPEVVSDRTTFEIIYKISWTEELKNALYPIKPWNQTADIRIPRRYDCKEDLFGMIGEYLFEPVIALAEVCSPSSEVIDLLLSMVGSHYDGLELLEALKKFCQNGIEVEQIDKEMKEKIALTLIDSAFNFDICRQNSTKNGRKPSMEERELAFDIIEMLNVRDGPALAAAKRYIHDSLDGGRYSTVEGPDMSRVGSWLAEDTSTRGELIKMTEEILAKAQDDISVIRSKDFLDILYSKKSVS